MQGKHAGTYNKIQYKLWAETTDSEKHKSKEVPPVWNQDKKSKASTEGTDMMATAVADKVMSILNVEVAPPGETRHKIQESQLVKE